MSITVRLIFWGLVGFVPNTEGHNSLTALLVDPNLVQTESADPRCDVPPHLAAVYLFDGQCEGDCQRIPPHRDGDFQAMALDKPLRGQPLPLAWLLNREDIDISGDEAHRLKLRKPWLSFGRKVAPESERQAAYFSWVQSMDMLTGEHGRLSDDCIEGNEDCPIQARFKVQGGKAGACHFYHRPEPPESTERLRNLQLFDYTGPRESFPRVVADALLVEFEVEGDRVTLLSRSLPGQPKSVARAYLKPVQGSDKLTIIVANFPRRFGHAEKMADPDHDHEAAPACTVTHSDALFSVLASRPRSKVVRKETPEIQRTLPGSCEPEAIELADLLAKAPEQAHAATACDGLIIR